MKLDYISILTIVGFVLCSLTTFILFFYQKRKSCRQNILGYYFLTLTIGLFLLFTLVSKLILVYPHFFRITLLLAYIYPALAYLYVRQNLVEKLSWRDLIYFTPALFYFIDYSPFFLLSSEEKLPIVIYNINHFGKLMKHNDGWIVPAWFHMIFRNVICLLFLLLSIRILLKLKKDKNASFLNKKSINLKWLTTFVILQALFFIPSLLLIAFGNLEFNFTATILPIILMCSFTCFLLFLNPTIFYSIEEIENATTPNYELTEIDFEIITEKIDVFIKEKKPFLNQKYSLNDFAKAVDINSRKISIFLNKHNNLNYNDFINQLRIEYCIEKLTNQDWQNLTLDAISKECGFNNRNSFTSAFKKQIGITPSEYIKNRP